MTDDETDPAYRSRFRSAPGDVSLRADPDDEDDMMELRIPIASSGEVRNEGDEPLTRAELKGMAEQVNDLTTGVFPEHGVGDMVSGGHYSQFEKLGYWAGGDIEPEAAADGEDLLMATARMPDPETLPAATGEYRKALAILKEQAKRDIPIDASIGWREDGNFPGGVDLMEASIVGIGADPRTNTEASADPVATVTRAATGAGADPADLLGAVRAAVGNADLRDLTPEQADLATRLLERFVDSQGDATLRDFEHWLWEQGEDLDGDAVTAAQTAIDEFCREMSPYDDAVSESFAGWLSDQSDGDTDDMTDDDTAPDDEGATDPDDEQTADDGETTEREGDACPDCSADAVAGADYCHNCGAALTREDDEDEDDERDADAEILDEVRKLREEQQDLRERIAAGESPSDLAEDPGDVADEIRDGADGDDTGEGDGTDTDEQTRDADPSEALTDEWTEGI